MKTVANGRGETLTTEFRAFNKLTGKMWYTSQKNIELSLARYGWSMYDDTNNVGDGPEEVVHDDIGVLMQYTGLKDKNKERIYEGDIITQPDTGVVMWDNGKAQFYFRFKDTDSGFPSSQLAMASVLVIGNIYENPELLKS